MAEARKIDMDRLAADAMAAGKPGSIRLDLIPELAGCVCAWQIAVEPLSPRTMSEGGIALPPITVDAEKYAITIGRVIGVGPTALDGKTQSGVELRRLTDDIDSAEKLLGKYVLYQKFTGIEVKRRDTGQVVLLLEVTNLLMIIKNPDDWMFRI